MAASAIWTDWKRCSEIFLQWLYLEKRLLRNSKKRPDQFKIDSTSEDFKGVCET